MSWFGSNKTLCEELNATSTKTAESRQKAVDGFYNTVRDTVVKELRTFAAQNKVKKTTISFDDIFADDGTTIGYFRKAVGNINPPTPTVQEIDAYGERITTELNEQGVIATYNNGAISANWEVVPTPELETTTKTPVETTE
jgi:hypothetical protein